NITSFTSQSNTHTTAAAISNAPTHPPSILAIVITLHIPNPAKPATTSLRAVLSPAYFFRSSATLVILVSHSLRPSSGWVSCLNTASPQSSKNLSGRSQP